MKLFQNSIYVGKWTSYSFMLSNTKVTLTYSSSTMENTRIKCDICSILTVKKTIFFSSISFVECEQVNIYKVAEKKYILAHFKVCRFISYYTQYFACTYFFCSRMLFFETRETCHSD